MVLSLRRKGEARDEVVKLKVGTRYKLDQGDGKMGLSEKDQVGFPRLSKKSDMTLSQ